jgi:cell wall-associated NlpC family hydrolase
MSEAAARDAIVREARSWIGTPYRHMGRTKGRDGGVDCAQLVWCIYHACGLVPFIPMAAYPPDFMLHQGVERYMAAILDHAKEIAPPPKAGDLVLYRFGRLYAHGAIVDAPGWPFIIHAWHGARAVIPDRGDQPQLVKRAKKFFSRFE